jgi:RHH-type proline utilization regulon transcriptional repressor/proline dehydrogenase/delta 1-pyrroline-5-carboxylate dehydrogenase
VGERNLYALHPRGRILLLPLTTAGLHRQLAAALATGNTAVVDPGHVAANALDGLPPEVAVRVRVARDWEADGPFAGALVEGDAARVVTVQQALAELPGPIVLTQAATTEELRGQPGAYVLDWLLEEVSTSINTTAAGGNASLMAMG